MPGRAEILAWLFRDRDLCAIRVRQVFVQVHDARHFEVSGGNLKGAATVGGIRKSEITQGFLNRRSDPLCAVAAPLTCTTGGESSLLTCV